VALIVFAFKTGADGQSTSVAPFGNNVLLENQSVFLGSQQINEVPLVQVAINGNGVNSHEAFLAFEQCCANFLGKTKTPLSYQQWLNGSTVYAFDFTKARNRSTGAQIRHVFTNSTSNGTIDVVYLALYSDAVFLKYSSGLLVIEKGTVNAM